MHTFGGKTGENWCRTGKFGTEHNGNYFGPKWLTHVANTQKQSYFRIQWEFVLLI